MKRLVLLIIRSYQLTRCIRPACCRFYPSCSDYAHESISKHGIFKGFVLSFARILRCQPFSAGGVDTVPENFDLGLFGKKPDDYSMDLRQG